MDTDIALLCATAATMGVIHTFLGPDHYLPFIAMARAGRWSLRRTLAVTAACGLGHVAGSVLLGLVGVALGVAVFSLERIESVRGDLAGWLLLAFGLAYACWGLRRAYRKRPHEHWHAHADGTVHKHPHVHAGDHVHVHAGTNAPASAAAEVPASVTPWVLFTIFLFGPCEPLIPILMYPAAQASWWGVAVVTAVFAVATLATMTTVVAAACLGLTSARLGRMERFGHVVAGTVVACCGLAILAGL